MHALAESRGTILSGGTDFFPALVDRPMTSPVIDISGVAEIKGIRTTEEHIHIGGRTTWSEIVAAPLPRGFAGDGRGGHARFRSWNAMRALWRVSGWQSKNDAATSRNIDQYHDSSAPGKFPLDFQQTGLAAVPGHFHCHGSCQSPDRSQRKNHRSTGCGGGMFGQSPASSAA